MILTSPQTVQFLVISSTDLQTIIFHHTSITPQVLHRLVQNVLSHESYPLPLLLEIFEYIISPSI